MKNDWKKVYPNQWGRAEKVLKGGGVIVATTDTLYGILARASDKKAVERIYKIKGRDEGKPFIILITRVEDLKQFGVSTSNPEVFKPKVSILLPTSTIVSKKLKYLHRGKNSLAFRMISPRNRNLYHLIRSVGPLVAPSANPQGEVPAKSMWEAKKYFGDKIDMYMCGHTRVGRPSTIISLVSGKPVVIRK